MSAPGLKNSLISACHPQVQWVGRVAQSASFVRLFWSGSGFVVRFEGTGLNATVLDPNNRFTLLLDGEVAFPSCGPFASGARALISGLAPGEHTVTLLRRSEAMFGETRICELEVQDGHFLPPPAAPPQLEVLGDSISCGYGNEAAHSDVPFSVHTENHYLTYAALLARQLGSPLSTIAWSGRGVIRNYADNDGLLLPQMYARTFPLEHDNSPWHFEDSTGLVLINAGTNDFACEPHPSASRFIDGYVAMLRLVRTLRPKTPIVATLGPMLAPHVLQRVQGYVREAVARRAAEGDPDVHFFALTTPNLQPGTNSHPSVVTHERMASELLAFVNRVFMRQA